MKKIFTLAAVLLLIVSLAGCTKKEEEKPTDDNNNSEVVKDDKNDDVANKNPYTNYESLEELKVALPYEFNSYDDLFTEMTDVTYSLIANKEGNPIVHIEAYKETKDTLITLLLRVSDMYEGKTDLAGIYDELEDKGVDEQGKHNYGDDKNSLVTWDEDGVHYSLYTTEVALSSLK